MPVKLTQFPRFHYSCVIEIIADRPSSFGTYILRILKAQYEEHHHHST